MSTSAYLLVHLVPLADKTPDDNDVVAGWVGAVVFIALILAVAVIGWSLTNHLKKARALAAEDEASSDAPPSR